ncbi:hypothetical protein V8C37DRAFT_367356 [Trichoderma ceciliae]
MADRIFRIFNPREPKGDPVEKRRAQLRRAQQSYRDRKDKYTKALEAELARARKSEADLTYEVQLLRGKVQILTTRLSENGICFPPEFNCERSSHHPNLHADASELTTRNSNLVDGQTQTAVVSPVDMELVPAEESTSQGNISTGESSNVQQHDPNSLARETRRRVTVSTAKATTPSEFGGKTRLCELDTTIVGMEFVLTLERPCLGHLHGNPKKPEEPHGHALTTTVQLQSSLSLPPIDPKYPVPPSCQNAPAAVLERLLTLAPSVSADGDVTPIQAWNYIRRQPHFGWFEIQHLNNLAEKLRGAMKCHGFGAAVQTGVFESAVRELLSPVSRRIA